MDEFLEELKQLLAKHNATLLVNSVDHDLVASVLIRNKITEYCDGTIDRVIGSEISGNL